MSSLSNSATETTQAGIMQRYYKVHATIYDLTRWTFLFGRKRLVRELAKTLPDAGHILEVGCGTGFNLERIYSQFPKSCLTGMDVSAEMLKQSSRRFPAKTDRLRLIEMPYQKGQKVVKEPQDIILFSYCLTMINPHWASLIEQAKADLRPGGLIAVVDFHNSKFNGFKKHMGNNHVRMDGHLLPFLEDNFKTTLRETHSAYAGMWEFLIYIGKNDINE